MNREIKFRVWDIAGNEYLFTERPNKWFSTRSGLVYYNFLEVCERMGRFTMEQFTGLKDKNGKDIYEGDIVKKYWKNAINGSYEGDHNFSSFEVKWNQQHCGFGITIGNNHVYEVIGNIHENPDLIKS